MLSRACLGSHPANRFVGSEGIPKMLSARRKRQAGGEPRISGADQSQAEAPRDPDNPAEQPRTCSWARGLPSEYVRSTFWTAFRGPMGFYRGGKVRCIILLIEFLPWQRLLNSAVWFLFRPWT